MVLHIGVRDGGQGGCPPPIRAVCRHTFGQRVDIIRAKHNTCLNNTNLGSGTAVNGNNSATTLPPSPGKFLLLPPPPTEFIRAKQLGLPPPPPMDVGPYAYGTPAHTCWTGQSPSGHLAGSDHSFIDPVGSLLGLPNDCGA